MPKRGIWDGRKEGAWVVCPIVAITSSKPPQGVAKRSPAHSVRVLLVFFLPPAHVASCHTACSSAGVASSGDFSLLSKGDGWVGVFLVQLQSNVHRSDASVTGVSLEHVKIISDSSLITSSLGRSGWNNVAGPCDGSGRKILPVQFASWQMA